MKKPVIKKKWILAGCLVLAAGTAAFLGLRGRSGRKKIAAIATSNVRSYEAKTGTIENTVSGTGTLAAADTLDLNLLSLVTVDQVYVSAGDHVMANDALARVDALSVLSALESVQDQIAALDEKLEDWDEDDVDVVDISEYSTVSEDTDLEELEDMLAQVEYEKMIAQRQELVDILLQLTALYKDPTLYAPIDGTIQSVNCGDAEEAELPEAQSTGKSAATGMRADSEGSTAAEMRVDPGMTASEAEAITGTGTQSDMGSDSPVSSSSRAHAVSVLNTGTRGNSSSAVNTVSVMSIASGKSHTVSPLSLTAPSGSSSTEVSSDLPAERSAGSDRDDSSQGSDSSDRDDSSQDSADSDADDSSQGSDGSDADDSSQNHDESDADSSSQDPSESDEEGSSQEPSREPESSDDSSENIPVTRTISDLSFLTIAEPVTGAVIPTELTFSKDTPVTAVIRWTPAGSTFAAGTVYTAEVELTAAQGYVFDEKVFSDEDAIAAGKLTIANGSGRTAVNQAKVKKDGCLLTLSIIYKETARNSHGDSDDDPNNSQEDSTGSNGNDLPNDSQNGGLPSGGTGTRTGSISLGSYSASGSSSSASESKTESLTGLSAETAVFTISSDARMQVSVTVDELDILSLSVGQKAAVTVDAADGETFDGTITEVHTSGGSSSSGVTKYSAVIEMERTDKMLAGMNASVVVTISAAENVLMIPEAALQERGNRITVYTEYDESTQVLGGEVEVTCGASDGTSVEILSGLSEGDTVYYSYSDNSSSGFGGFGDMGGMSGGFPGGGSDFTPPSGGGSDRGGSNGGFPGGSSGGPSGGRPGQ